MTKKQDIADWEAKKSSYARNHSEWERQLAVKKTELADLQYKLNGKGYTPQTLSKRLKNNNPLQTQLNKALIITGWVRMQKYTKRMCLDVLLLLIKIKRILFLSSITNLHSKAIITLKS